MAHIALDARLTHYTGGGIARYIRELAAAVPAIDALPGRASGHRYSIVHMRKAGASLPMPPGARRLNAVTPAHNRLERLALAVELLPHRIHLLHSPDFIAPLRLGGWRSVISIHDLSFLRYPQYLTDESRRYYNGQIAASVRTADHIITISEATRRDVIEMLGVKPDRVTTVYLAASGGFAPASASQVNEIRQRLGLGDYLLFVGTYEPRKNVPGLLRAYATLRDAPPLVLAGRQGWLFEDARKLVGELGLSDRVRFELDTPEHLLPALYAAARMLILPSHYEGFGLPVIEAQACGTPVIVSNRASLPEVAGEAALIIDPDAPDELADAIDRLMTDSALHAALRERGFANAARFSWQRCARETLAIYNAVLAA